MNPYAGLVRTLGRTSAFAWLGSHTLHRVDLRFRDRHRSLTSLGTGFPLLYLTLRGTSAEPRTVPLLHVADGEHLVVFASNWGRPQDPAWARELTTDPHVTVTIDGTPRGALARRASSAEARRYWPRADAVWPGYAAYRRRAGREIPVFVLELARGEPPMSDCHDDDRERSTVRA